MYALVTRLFCGLIVATLLVALLIEATPPAAACPGATRVRVFPLGVAKGEVIVAASVERRPVYMLKHYFGGFHLPSLYWAGTMVLRRYVPGKGFTAKDVKLGSYIATVSYYHRDMRRVLRASLARAKRLAGFRAFGRPKLWRCKGKKRCGDWTVRALGRSGLHVTTLGKRHRLSKKNQKLLVEVGLADEGKPGTMLKHVGFGPVLRYRQGTLQVEVVSLSSGFAQYMGAPFGWHDRRCKGVDTCVPPTNLEGHQASVDFLRVSKVVVDATVPGGGKRRSP